MKHPAKIVDCTVWILQGLLPLIYSLLTLRKMYALNISEGLIRTLVLLVLAESVCGLIF